MQGTLFIPELRELMAARDHETIREVFGDLHPADGAELISGLEPHEILDILAITGNRTSIEIFEQLDLAAQKKCLEEAEPKAILPFIEGMSSDDRVDLLKQAEPDIADRLMPLMAQAERDDIRRLLAYEEGTAGAIMTTEYASVDKDITATEALTRLRMQAPNKETVYYVYVVDQHRRLKGFVTLKDILLARPNQKIESIMEDDVIRVSIDENVEDVADKISHYDFLAIPVIDRDDRLVGIVTVDDILDVVEEEATEDIYHLAAAGKPLDYLNTGIFKIARERILWLFILVLTGFVAGAVMQKFQSQLSAVIALVFFIPVLSGTGGNAGTQTTTVIIRGLATGELEMRDIFRILFKELRIALIVGLAMGLLTAFRAILTSPEPHLVFPLSLTVGLAMVGCVVLAISAGAILPVIFKRIGLDPALMSGPFISSLMDVFTLLLYLSLAAAIIPV
jgi:magnesium transporter